MDALKCWNFERMLDTDLHRQPTPCALTLEQLIKEGDGSDGSAIVDLVEDWRWGARIAACLMLILTSCMNVLGMLFVWVVALSSCVNI